MMGLPVFVLLLVALAEVGGGLLIVAGGFLYAGTAAGCPDRQQWRHRHRLVHRHHAGRIPVVAGATQSRSRTIVG